MPFIESQLTRDRLGSLDNYKAGPMRSSIDSALLPHADDGVPCRLRLT